MTRRHRIIDFSGSKYDIIVSNIVPTVYLFTFFSSAISSVDVPILKLLIP